jgi:NAD(P)-dependent dehydrogenase (short-subunit alcohol dehydrogenase family)
MEGKFYRFKTANHPHTNMAKAALNMMTRTSAEDYRKSRIYMTAVRLRLPNPSAVYFS